MVTRGGSYDAWDLQVRGGVFGKVRINLVAEEHGSSRQLIRVRVPRVVGMLASVAIAVLTCGMLMAVRSHQHWFAVTLTATDILLIALVTLECTAAASLVDKVLKDPAVISGVPIAAQRTRRIVRPDPLAAETSEPFAAADEPHESLCT